MGYSASCFSPLTAGEGLNCPEMVTKLTDMRPIDIFNLDATKEHEIKSVSLIATNIYILSLKPPLQDQELEQVRHKGFI